MENDNCYKHYKFIKVSADILPLLVCRFGNKGFMNHFIKTPSDNSDYIYNGFICSSKFLPAKLKHQRDCV